MIRRAALPVVGRTVLVAALAVAAAARPAAAQTPFTSLGLGYPIMPIDGRAAAMGGAGVGLLGSSFSLINPAEMTQHTSPSFAISFSGENVDVDGTPPLATGRHRFNVIRAVAPVRGFVVGFGFGGLFDQDWTARFQDTLALSDGGVPFEETREHDGGISEVDLSVARSIGPLSLGISAQRFTGSLRQSFTRTFDPPTGEAPSLGAAGGSQTLAYSGWRFKGGAAFDWRDRLLLSGAVTLSSTLTATAKEEGGGVEKVDVPLTVELGASFRVVPELLVGGAVGLGGWSSVGSLGESRSHDTMWMGGGVEYSGLSLFSGTLPIRLGLSRRELPFDYGDQPAVERAFTGGFGWIFRQGAGEVNLGLEFGKRGDLSADGAEESFRRLTLSFALRQFRPF